ncbi:hypothetical protein F4821DRAFT_250997 [Hypoxylon rubiginosum]|uniref:Uncharacterized protein n=1 Tax=Hypoxylon rubiginosum TaxID=110542 RepID=A0ACC0CK08_9PEZI|nr:hypothetical protein F4821DRAFT_250997 [Hypoxylon rubiginosum]
MSREILSQLSPAQLAALMDQPAMPPPPGVTPNFEHRFNRNGLSISASTICLVASTVAILIRIYSRLVKMRTANIRDFLVFIGYVLYVGYVSVCYKNIATHGHFIHTWDVPFRDMSYLLYSNQLVSNFYAASMMITKTAILQEWISIFVPTGNRNYFYWLSYGVIGFNILWYSSSIITLNLSCIPYAAIFDLAMPAKCINFNAVIAAGAAINLVSDLIILALPQHTIWRLNMTKKKKMGISVVFAIGIFACISAACRLDASIKYTRSTDSLYDGAVLSLWAISEMTCGFLVLCIPTFPRAFSGPGLLSQFTDLIKTWSRLPSRWTTQGSNQSWPSDVNAGKRNSTSDYRQVDDHVPLSDMSNKNHWRFESESNRSGVLRTTQFTATEHYVSSGDCELSQPDIVQEQWSNPRI